MGSFNRSFHLLVSELGRSSVEINDLKILISHHISGLHRISLAVFFRHGKENTNGENLNKQRERNKVFTHNPHLSLRLIEQRVGQLFFRLIWRYFELTRKHCRNFRQVCVGEDPGTPSVDPNCLHFKHTRLNPVNVSASTLCGFTREKCHFQPVPAGTYAALLVGMKSGTLFIMNTIILAGSLLLSLRVVSADQISAVVSIKNTSITSQGGMKYSYSSQCDATFGTVTTVSAGVKLSLAGGTARRADNGDALLDTGFECTKPKTFKNNALNVNASTPVITGLTTSQAEELKRVAGIHGATISLNNECHDSEKSCEKYTTINNSDGSTSTVLKYTSDQVIVTLPEAPAKTLSEYFSEAGLANFAREFTGNRAPSVNSPVTEFRQVKDNSPSQTADLVKAPNLSNSSNANL
jgi:hypothetical protein